MTNLIPITLICNKDQVETTFNCELSVEHNIGQYLRNLYLTSSLQHEKEFKHQWSLLSQKTQQQVFSKEDLVHNDTFELKMKHVDQLFVQNKAR